jgi:hypothetical protein
MKAGKRDGFHAKNQRQEALAETTTKTVEYAVQVSADGDALRQRIGDWRLEALNPATNVSGF